MSFSRRDFLKRAFALTAAGILVPAEQTVEAVRRLYPLDRTMLAGKTGFFSITGGVLDSAWRSVRPGDLIVVQSFRGDPFPGTSFATTGMYHPIVDIFVVNRTGTLACIRGMPGPIGRVHRVNIPGRYERIVTRMGAPVLRPEDYFALRKED